MKKWWEKKKVWGTILACAALVIGSREGWDPQLSRDIAWTLMSGVTVEGVLDAFAIWKGRS